MLNSESDNVRFAGYRGAWYVIDETTYRSKKYFLLESEIWGDEAPAIIADEYGDVVLDDVWNGFEDLEEAFE